MSAYKIIEVFLVESYFKSYFNHSDADKAIETKIAVRNEKTALHLVVVVELQLTFKEADKLILETKVQMMGIFEPSDWNDPLLEDFANINAPAIIYPFVREHIASLTTKAKTPYILPPFNFVELAKNRKNN
jgi:preprotein translocase subunit SecB